MYVDDVLVATFPDGQKISENPDWVDFWNFGGPWDEGESNPWDENPSEPPLAPFDQSVSCLLTVQGKQCQCKYEQLG